MELVSFPCDTGRVYHNQLGNARFSIFSVLGDQEPGFKIKMSRQENVENMEGIEMTGPANDIPPLSDQEKRILEVYDKLEELQVEIALLKAQGVISSRGI